MTRKLDHKPGDTFWAKAPIGGLANPYRFVKLTDLETAGQCDTAGELSFGVIENHQLATGGTVEIILDGIPWIECGATVADQAEVTTDSTGRAVTAVGGDAIAGRVIKGAAVGKLASLILYNRKSGKSGGASLVAKGTATLIGGTKTVATALVKAGDLIFLTRNTPAGTAGDLSAPVASITAATSFVINSASGTDTSTVNWAIYR